MIQPNTIWYMVWDVTKSIMYMISLYTLAYAAAFKYEGDDSAANFELIVDLVQIVDIIHVFFTATKVANLSQAVIKWRKNELQEIESKAGIKLNTVSKFESEWEFNQKYLAVNYIRGNFFIDLLAVVPFLLGPGVSRIYLSMRFFRLFRI